jgi:hypothetical protein
MKNLRPLVGLGGRALAVFGVLAAILAAPVPALAHDADPADPEAQGSFLGYEPVLEGYASVPIVEEPRDWRGANDEARELDGPRGQILMPGETPPELPKPDSAADDAAADPNDDAAIAAEATDGAGTGGESADAGDAASGDAPAGADPQDAKAKSKAKVPAAKASP